MPFSTSTPAQPEQVSQPVRIPPPTAAQQLVLDRIEQQRERLRARRAAHDRPLAVAESHAGAGADESLVLRTAWFVREHPWAVPAMVLLAAQARSLGGGAAAGAGAPQTLIPLLNHPCTSSAPLAGHSHRLRPVFAFTNDLATQ